VEYLSESLLEIVDQKSGNFVTILPMAVKYREEGYSFMLLAKNVGVDEDGVLVYLFLPIFDSTNSSFADRFEFNGLVSLTA
jgi:hypothetical protein